VVDYIDEDTFLGKDRKGLYVCHVGGLPLFASGTRVDSLCTGSSVVFEEPCDAAHICIEHGRIHCVRSGLCVGEVVHDGKYRVFSKCLRFLDLDAPWPPESQPENFWGSEGQYRAWNKHEMSDRPLSY
jgi:hypothetical protein